MPRTIPRDGTGYAMRRGMPMAIRPELVGVVFGRERWLRAMDTWPAPRRDGQTTAGAARTSDGPAGVRDVEPVSCPASSGRHLSRSSDRLEVGTVLKNGLKVLPGRATVERRGGGR